MSCKFLRGGVRNGGLHRKGSGGGKAPERRGTAEKRKGRRSGDFCGIGWRRGFEAVPFGAAGGDGRGTARKKAEKRRVPHYPRFVDADVGQCEGVRKKAEKNGRGTARKKAEKRRVSHYLRFADADVSRRAERAVR